MKTNINIEIHIEYNREVLNNLIKELIIVLNEELKGVNI
jgi:hypothetical protein